MDNFSGFMYPVFSVRNKQRRVCNFQDLDSAIEYRNTFPVEERDSYSIEVFEYGF